MRKINSVLFLLLSLLLAACAGGQSEAADSAPEQSRFVLFYAEN